MSLVELQKEVAKLPPSERMKLAAFLTAMRLKESGEWMTEADASLVDQDGWVPLEEAKRRLLPRP